MSTGSVTPNVGLQIPGINQANWQVAMQYNFTLLDLLLSGNLPIEALDVLSLVIATLSLTMAQVVAGLGYTPLNPANNLADVANTSTALANLGGIGSGSVRGAWSSTSVYAQGNIVTYNGGTYISLQNNNQNQEPDTQTAYWTLFLSSTPVTPFEEIPAGVYPGTVYTMSYTPVSMMGVFLNGNLLRPTTDYTISGTAITLTNATSSGDTVQAIYLKSAGTVSGGGIGNFQREVPAGTINGTNAVFTTSYPPNPAGSLLVFVNGNVIAAANYSLTGDTITFVTAAIPRTGATLEVYYAH